MSDYTNETNTVLNSHFSVNRNNQQNLLAREHFTNLSEDLQTLNIIVPNNSTLDPYSSEQKYDENRTLDLFQGKPSPQNYTLVVQRAKIVAQSIPLFIYNETDALMRIRLTAVISGVPYDVSAPILYISNETTPRHQYVTNVSQWVRMVNSAANTAYNALLSAAGITQAAFVILGGPAMAPLFAYNNDNNFSWIFEQSYKSFDNTANPTQIKLYFNQLLNDKFMNAWDVFVHNDNNNPTLATQWQYEVVVQDENNGNFSGGYFTMKNLHYCYDNLIECKKILIGTSMGVQNEQSNGFYRYVSKDGLVYGANSGLDNSTIPVRLLLDLSVSPTLEEFGQDIIYQPSTYRYYNITSSTFQIINWRYLWTGNNGIIHECYQPYRSACSVKFNFILR